MASQKRAIRYKSIFLFFFPLATTPVMIGLTHTIINIALARLPFPEENIAIFTVIKSFVMILSGPTLIGLQLVIAYVDDQRSYRLVKKFVYIVAALLCLIIILFTYTPIGKFVLENLIGLKEVKNNSLAYTGLMISAALPLVQALRNIHQGIAVRLKKTKFFLPGVMLRLSFITIFLWIIVSKQLFSGVIAGSLTWIIGIGLEGLFIFAYLSIYYKGLDKAINLLPFQNKDRPTLRKITRFFIPLGVMMSLQALLQPIIQSGIARSETPAKSLAAYGIAWGIIAFVSGPIRLLHQVSLVFTEDLEDINWRPVRNFSLLTGFIVLVLLVFLSLSPIGSWLIDSIFGVSAETGELTRKVLLAFSIYPLIRAFRESYWGFLMNCRDTFFIATCKLINILVVFCTIFFGLTRLPIQPAVFGALAFTVGEGMESLLIWYFALKQVKKSAIIFNHNK